MPIDASTSATPRGAITPVMEALGHRASDEPAVLVRLLLLADDELTGEQLLVGSFLRRVSPPDLANPDVQIALEIFGERRLFKPTDIIWDDAHRVCIVEVEWTVADAANIVGK